MKSKRSYNPLLIILIILVFLSGCYNPSKLSYFNISSSYEDQAKNFDFKFYAYNSAEYQMNVYFKFNTSGLLFIKHKTKDYFFSKYQIRYEIYDCNVPKVFLDSATFRYIDTTDFNSPKKIIDSFPIPVNKAANYIIAYSFTDLNRNYTLYGFINSDRTNEFSRNNFFLRDANNQPLVENYVNKDQIFKVQFNNKQKDKLYVSYYKQQFPIAEPPYMQVSNSVKSIIRDSIFTIELQNGSSGNLLLNDPGIYFFQTDTNQQNGFSVFRFYSNFPLVTTPIQMLGPLQYITTKQEFAEMVNSKNTKSAIDNFWVKKTGNIDRAKELIRLFYNRMQEANVLFTSYKEGWKTDRGMIYLVLGEPSRVYRSATNETWYYGEERNMLSVTMIFEKTTGKFSDNDYTLDRGVEFKDTWYNGVESWRK